MTTTEPISLNYASKEWMVERLDRMGLTGTAAAHSKSIVEPIEPEAAPHHAQKYKMDQQTHRRAADDLTAFQSTLYSGGIPAGSPQIQREAPNDIWVQPRAHPFYSKDRVHISDKERIDANEPWRKGAVKAESIKNVNTK